MKQSIFSHQTCAAFATVGALTYKMMSLVLSIKNQYITCQASQATQTLHNSRAERDSGLDRPYATQSRMSMHRLQIDHSTGG